MSPSLYDKQSSCDLYLQPSRAQRTGFCVDDETSPRCLTGYTPLSPQQYVRTQAHEEKRKRLAYPLRRPEVMFCDSLASESILPRAECQESLGTIQAAPDNSQDSSKCPLSESMWCIYDHGEANSEIVRLFAQRQSPPAVSEDIADAERH